MPKPDLAEPRADHRAGLRGARATISTATRGEIREAVETALDLLDRGEVRVAERRPTATGSSTSG